MPNPDNDLRLATWEWRNHRTDWFLVGKISGAIVLTAMSTGNGASMFGRIDARSPCTELSPTHPLGVALGLVPDLIDFALSIAANPVADGEDLQVDSARSLVKRLGGLEEDLHGEILPEWAKARCEEGIDAAA